MLYIVHDTDYNYRIVVEAESSQQAEKKVHKYLSDTKQNGECWCSKNVKWQTDLCDNDTVL